MKKFMCLALAVCMVFVLAGTVLAADLEPQAVNYNNERYETNSKEQNGIQWILEAVVAIGADDQDDMYIEDDDWYPFTCKYCCDDRVVGEEGERCGCWCFPQTPCICCDNDFDYFIGPSRYLWVDDYDSGLPDTSNDYRDYITKVFMTPGCDYDEDFDIHCRTGYKYCEWWVNILPGDTYPGDFPEYPAGDDWVCPAYIFPDCIPEKGDCPGVEETLGCYPECIPCDIEVLYCQFEDFLCVEKDLNTADNGNGCEGEYECSWWHPYGAGPSSSETAIVFDRFEADMESSMAAVPTFNEVVYGWDDGDNPMDKVCFVTKPKWYDWNVTACDECDERVDVVLWSREKPYCGDESESSACCIPPGSQWCVDEPSFAFVRFFEMDLRNCDNISRIDLEMPVCCLCDEDIMWGVWEWVEGDTCDITECDPDCPDDGCDGGCGCECTWVPLDTEFVKECESPICDGEECDCKLQLGFSGACADDCNVGELCDLEDKVFALGWVAPYVVEDVLDNGIPYTVKAWACDPRNVVKADLVQNAVNPDDSITSEDPLFFRLDFEPGTGEGICKLEVSWILECSEQDLIGFYYWDDDAEDWVELAATWTEIGGGECEVSILFEGGISDLPGVVIGGGDTEIFDPTPVTPDPEPEPEPEPEPTPTPSTSSSGGCNVGTGAAVLLLLVPLGVLWFKRF